mmetsp:Transcript_32405/g.70852  ORF Transcript_32405/g.70852 Transcript_32405/m.70852 type:complete len:244 (-) Transcript_32405:2410-3141(-)
MGRSGNALIGALLQKPLAEGGKGRVDEVDERIGATHHVRTLPLTGHEEEVVSSEETPLIQLHPEGLRVVVTLNARNHHCRYGQGLGHVLVEAGHVNALAICSRRIRRISLPSSTTVSASPRQSVLWRLHHGERHEVWGICGKSFAEATDHGASIRIANLARLLVFRRSWALCETSLGRLGPLLSLLLVLLHLKFGHRSPAPRFVPLLLLLLFFVLLLLLLLFLLLLLLFCLLFLLVLLLLALL